MNNKFGKDLTVGSIPRHLLSFSIPMLIGNAMQVAYSIINTIWVGHLVGENAVGSIGVSFPVIFILIGFSMGITMATSILVSQYYGAKNFKMVEKVVNNSFSISLILSIVMATSGILASDSILRLIDTPSENFSMASGYLKISLLGFIPMYLVFLTISILRGIGDTVTPLIFMATGLGLNAILDPFLIGGFGPFPFHSLNGAAYASLISQCTSAIISIIYLNRKNHVIAFSPKKLTLNGRLTALIFKIGFPSIIQQTLISLSSIFIVGFVNAFGSAAINAFGAVQRVEMLAFMPALSMSMAAATLTGQNLGAGKPDRVKEIFKWGVIMSTSITLLISIIAVFLSKYIFIIFGIADDAQVLEIGTTYLRIVGSGYILLGIIFITSGITNGAGHTLITMCFTIMSLWLVRVPVSWLLSKTSLGIIGIWIAVVLSFFVTMIINLLYYFSGRWKKSVIVHPPLEMPIMD